VRHSTRQSAMPRGLLGYIRRIDVGRNKPVADLLGKLLHVREQGLNLFVVEILVGHDDVAELM
jgi:hypothetical protein